MIISHKHRYVFIEQAHTASSAIHAELCLNYDGVPILTKHASYADFLQHATEPEKGYFVFSGLRNPLDEVVSVYFKYLTDHKGRHSSPDRLGSVPRRREAFDFVTETRDFGAFLQRYYKRPYDNDTVIAHQSLDAVIRFENLQQDFAAVLKKIGIPQVRPLPLVNKTSERRHYLDYYDEAARDRALWVFGPYMRKWGYDLPPEWGPVTVPRSALIAFRVLGLARLLYRRYLRRRKNPVARLASRLADGGRSLAYRLLGW